MNIIKLTTGANATLSKYDVETIKVTVQWEFSPCDLDISCFMVGSNGKVLSDSYMIFYNQDIDPENSVKFNVKNEKEINFEIKPQLLSDTIEKCVFTATIDGNFTFKDIKGCKLIAESNETKIIYDINGANEEKALVFAELYKRNSELKARGIGRGFNGGLKPLAESFGVEIENNAEETQEQSVTPSVQTNTKSIENKKVNLTKIDILKEKVVVSLEKKNIQKEKSRIAIVIDASGSMSSLYKKGTVQRSFERALAVAACMDDDGELDVWFFSDKVLRAPTVTENDFEDYVKRNYEYPGDKRYKIGYGNNEPAVMDDVIKKYTKEEPRKDIPTYVMFFSDGGIYKDKEISKILKEASYHNIFWQFIGIGRSKFGILQKLDDLPGRFIDNADFFSLADLDKVSDEDLYNRLFNEFPIWISEARNKGILF